MDANGGRARGKVHQQHPAPKHFLNPSQMLPKHLQDTSRVPPRLWVHWPCQLSVPLCHRSARLDPGRDQRSPGISPRAVPCLDPPCSCIVPGGSRSGVWIQSCHLAVPRPHLGTALIPKSSGWRGRSPGLAGQALPWWGHVWGHCHVQVTQMLHWGVPVSPVASVSPLLGHPEGCRVAVSSPGLGTAWPWVGLCQTPQPGR